MLCAFRFGRGICLIFFSRDDLRALGIYDIFVN